MTPRILNLDAVDLQTPPTYTPSEAAAAKHGMRMGEIATRIGAQKLGYNLTAVPPGKRAFPFHCHRVNEEMFFVLEGSGEVRIGAERYPIRKGDFIACPPGGPELAHQIINTGSEELRYLAVSTRMYPELVEYPDSGKFGVAAQYPQGFRFVGRMESASDYWDGESD